MREFLTCPEKIIEENKAFVSLSSYYEILGLENFSSSVEVKTAFKRLALLYHPDRNPGDQTAEEKFKLINEAYQVLSHPERKSHYDMLLLYGQERYTPPPQPEEQPRDPYYRNNPHRYRSRPKAQGAPKPKPYYHITNNQAVLLAIILVGYAFFVLNTVYQFYARVQYMYALEEVENRNYRAALEHAAKAAGADKTFAKAHYLKGELSLEHFNYAPDAVKDFTLAIEHSQQPSIEYYLKRAMAYTSTHNQVLAIKDFDMVLTHHPDSLKLLKQIGDIYFYNFANDAQASRMYDKLISIGKATPEVYFNKGIIGKRQKNLPAAIESFSKAIMMNPTAQAYHERAMLEIDSQKLNEACRDWQQAKNLDPSLADPRLDFFCESSPQE